MNIKLKIYDGCIYNGESRMVAVVEYKNIVSYEVVTGKRATEIGLARDECIRDEYNEYLIITVKDGEKVRFCNSRVEMFRDFRHIN